MEDLKNLGEVMEILNIQEQMMEVLENQQAEPEEKDKMILSLKEEMEESINLNEQLTKQNKKLIKQTEKL